MKVNKDETFPHPYLLNHFIQFGISTWTEDEPETDQTESIRRAVYNDDGKFSPRGSSEVPIEDMELMIRACIQRDKIGIEELTNILSDIAESIKRLT
jgi:hypothetical protein